MNKLEAIATSKQFRKDADEILQRMKAFYEDFTENGVSEFEDFMALGRHTSLSINALEDCIMRQGMALKAIGNPTPYPESYNPASPVVEPTAGGLKM